MVGLARVVVGVVIDRKKGIAPWATPICLTWHRTLVSDYTPPKLCGVFREPGQTDAHETVTPRCEPGVVVWLVLLSGAPDEGAVVRGDPRRLALGETALDGTLSLVEDADLFLC